MSTTTLDVALFLLEMDQRHVVKLKQALESEMATFMARTEPRACHLDHLDIILRDLRRKLTRVEALEELKPQKVL